MIVFFSVVGENPPSKERSVKRRKFVSQFYHSHLFSRSLPKFSYIVECFPDGFEIKCFSDYENELKKCTTRIAVSLKCFSTKRRRIDRGKAQRKIFSIKPILKIKRNFKEVLDERNQADITGKLSVQKTTE